LKASTTGERIIVERLQRLRRHVVTSCEENVDLWLLGHVKSIVSANHKVKGNAIKLVKELEVLAINSRVLLHLKLEVDILRSSHSVKLGSTRPGIATSNHHPLALVGNPPVRLVLPEQITRVGKASTNLVLRFISEQGRVNAPLVVIGAFPLQELVQTWLLGAPSAINTVD